MIKALTERAVSLISVFSSLFIVSSRTFKTSVLSFKPRISLIALIATLAERSFMPLPAQEQTSFNDSGVFFLIRACAVFSLISSISEFVPISSRMLIDFGSSCLHRASIILSILFILADRFH